MALNLDPTVVKVLEAAVGHGLDDGRSWPAAPLNDTDFSRVLRQGFDHRLTGALAEAAADGSWAMTPEQFEQLADQHADFQAHVLQLECLLLDVADVFETAGIEFRVLKGLALAQQVYVDPAWRVAGDIDLLVPSDQFDSAVSTAIDQLNGHQPIGELRPGFDREFGKESLVRLGEFELDLHRTFVTGPFGLTIDLDELFASRTEINIGTRPLLALSAEHQFLHACYNVALGDYPVRLCSVRDLLLCLQHLDVDLDKIVAIAARWNGTAVVQRAAAVAIETVGAQVAAGFIELHALTVPRREQWLMGSYLTTARSYSRPLASLAVIPGLRPRLRYARAIVAPSAEYLKSRGWTASSHLQRALRRLRRHG